MKREMCPKTAIDEMASWTKSLQICIEQNRGQLLSVLDATTLPKGCSHEALAMLILSNIRQKVEEVNAAFGDLESAFRNSCSQH